MKLTFKEKAKLFWERNKVDILGWLIGAGVITGVGCVAAHMMQKSQEKYEAELAENVQKLNEELKKEEEAAIAAEEQIASNPENQLTEGGYVAPDRNNLYEADCPNILANSVPLTSMGQFGQDIIDLYKKNGLTGKKSACLIPKRLSRIFISISVMKSGWKRSGQGKPNRRKNRVLNGVPK